ncbi:MAG: hypothetical protein ACWGQW_01010 [bacterium]
MAAGAWIVFTRAKRKLGAGSDIVLSGVFRMCLMTSAASADLVKYTNTGVSTWDSIQTNEISARGGYAVGGRSVPNIKWTVGASTKQYKFTYTATGIIFTASGSSLNNIKYAVIRNSTGASAGYLLCFCTLSTSPFTINSPNTLTILPNASGVFTLA